MTLNSENSLGGKMHFYLLASPYPCCQCNSVLTYSLDYIAISPSLGNLSCLSSLHLRSILVSLLSEFLEPVALITSYRGCFWSFFFFNVVPKPSPTRVFGFFSIWATDKPLPILDHVSKPKAMCPTLGPGQWLGLRRLGGLTKQIWKISSFLLFFIVNACKELFFATCCFSKKTGLGGKQVWLGKLSLDSLSGKQSPVSAWTGRNLVFST